MGKLDDWLSWPHEIFHIAAAYLVGVPRRAMTYTAQYLYIPYRVPRWKFVVIGLAPLAVWLPIVAVLWQAWQRSTLRPSVLQFMIDMIFAGVGIAFPDVAQRFGVSPVSSVLAWLAALTTIRYLPNALHDALIALPRTLAQWRTMPEFRDGKSGGHDAGRADGSSKKSSRLVPAGFFACSLDVSAYSSAVRETRSAALMMDISRYAFRSNR